MDRAQSDIISIHEIEDPLLENDGFEIHKCESQQLITFLIVEFYNRLLLQAYKLGLVDVFNYREYGDNITPIEIDDLIQAINQLNKISVDFAVRELRECPSFLRFVGEEVLIHASQHLRCPIELLKIHIDGILVNVPSTPQRLYKFHSETYYYPYRKSFINIWVPLVRAKSAENGTMIVKHRGHQRIYDFTEYSGYDKIEEVKEESISEDEFLYQFEIPEYQMDGLSDILVDLDVGEAFWFSSNLPHKSTVNTSDSPSYALVIRAYDYRGDLTLSDRTNVRPLTAQAARSGFPGMRSVGPIRNIP